MALYPSTGLPTVEAYDVSKSILEPLFMGQDYMQYFDVMPNVSGTIVVDKFKQLGNVTTAFEQTAFDASAGSDIGDTITITPVRREAEIAFAGNSLYNKIKGQLMRGGHDFNNVDGTVVKQILLDLIGQGVKSDFNKQLFLSNNSGSGTGAFDHYDGIFDVAFNASATKINRGDIGQNNNEALASGKGKTILQKLYDIASPELLDAGEHVYMVSGDIADDYMAQTLENSGYAAAGYGALVDGVPQLTYRGIPLVVRRDWDVAITSNVAQINGADNAVETHRAILTTKDAFMVATDFEQNNVEQWYSMDNKQYRFRVNYSIGCALKDAKLATYYTPEDMV